MQALVDNVNREDAATVAPIAYDSVEEMLPNSVRVPLGSPAGTEPTPAFHSVVSGTVSSVTHQDGWIENPSAVGQPTLTDFDDQRAWWRTLRVTLTVDEVLAGEEDSTVVFDWGLMGSTANGENADAVAEGLRNLGPVVVFLNPSAHSNYLLRVMDAQHGMIQITENESLHMPFVLGDEFVSSEEYESVFLGGVDTLPELRATADEPVRLDTD